MAETVRFTEILKVGGKPQSYLAFADPRKDKAFIKASREHRVVTLKQSPTAKQKDSGVIAVLLEKYVSYLIFPRSLAPFVGKRVIGIKYEQLKDSDLVTPTPQKSTSTKPAAAQPPGPKSKPKPAKPVPQPTRFVVRLRLTAIKEIEQVVEAMTRPEADAEAIATTRDTIDLSDAKISIRLIRSRLTGQKFNF